MRIVSLVPSATEIICNLGLGEQLVGVTHECDYPPSVQSLPKVTRTLIPHDAPSATIDAMVRERLKTQKALYTLDLPTLERLQPDLIVSQALCDVCAVAEEEVSAAACSLPGRPRVVNLEPTTLNEVLESIRQVGVAAEVPVRAEEVIAGLQRRLAALAERGAVLTKRPRVVLLEWIEPLFSCGHWSPELVSLAGGTEMVGLPGRRSRVLEWDEVVAARPDVMVIACCGFTVARTEEDLPFLRAKPGWDELPCTRAGRVHVVDGSAYFSRPGPRLVDSAELLGELLAGNYS